MRARAVSFGRRETDGQMDINWSEQSIRREYGEFGVVEMRQRFHLVTLSMDSGSFFVVGSFSTLEQFPMPHFANFVSELEKAAVTVAARASADRYVAEAAAYVRTRPDGCRSDYFDEDDEDSVARHMDDVRNGLVQALAFTDLYQAARAFEATVPFLVADYELIDTLDPIIASFRREFETDAALWVEKVASARQTHVSNRSPLVRGETKRLLESFDAPHLATL